MSFETWIGFVSASVLLLIIPGPTVMLVLTYAITQGRKVAVATALGVALGDFIAMSAALGGLGALLVASETAFTVLKWIGAAYLLWLGIKLLRAAPVAPEADMAGARKARSIFWHACAVTALNPKSGAFFIAFVPLFLNPAAPLLPQMAIMVATFVSLACANSLIFALAADRLRSRIRRPSVLLWLNRAGAGALIAMAAATAALRRV